MRLPLIFLLCTLWLIARAALAVPSADYVDLQFFETPPESVVSWDASSLKELTPTATGGIVHLRGRLAPGHDLFFEDHWVKADAAGHFDVPIALERDPRLFHVRLFDPAREFRIYPLVYFWNRLPDGPPAALPHRIGFAQAYAGDSPTQTVDLDALDEARLTMRIYLPPDIAVGCESWSLIVENVHGGKPRHIARAGFPPPYLDWSALRGAFSADGEYRYRFELRYAGHDYSGRPNRLHVFHGSRLMPHDYLPDIQFEPRQEAGILAFSATSGRQFHSAYLGAELAVVLDQRWLLRADGAIALAGLSTAHAFTQARIGIGWRLFGHHADSALGRPLVFQLDTLVNYSALFPGPQASLASFGAPGLLLEPRLVLGSAHRLTPWIEYAVRTPATFQRVSFGLRYAYHLRAWSVALGVALSVDKQLTPSASGLDVMKGGTSITLLL